MRKVHGKKNPLLRVFSTKIYGLRHCSRKKKEKEKEPVMRIQRLKEGKNRKEEVLLRDSAEAPGSVNT
jgi:hypothetical protein